MASSSRSRLCPDSAWLCNPEPCGHLLDQPQPSWKPSVEPAARQHRSWSTRACTPRGRRKPAGETSRRLLVEAFPPQSARLTPLLKRAQPQPSFWMSTLPTKVAPPCCEPLPGDCGRLHCPWVLASISFSSPPRSVFHSQRVLVVTDAVKLQLFVPSCSKLCVTVAPNSLPFAIDKDSVATCLSRSKRWGVFNSILCIHSAVGPKVTQGQINFKT